MITEKFQAYFNNFLWFLMTIVSALFLFFMISLRKQKEIRNILVIQSGKIGDMVCATPFFREIKKNYPQAFLTVIAIGRSKDVLKNNPHVNEVLILEDYSRLRDKFKLFAKLRKRKYDWSFSMLPGVFNNLIAFWSLIPNRVVTTYRYSGEITNFFARFNNYRLEYQRHSPLEIHYARLLKFIGIEKFDQTREIFITPADEKKAEVFLQENNLKETDLLIGLSVTAGIPLKDWGLDKFAATADLLIENKNAKIIFVGSGGDRPVIEKTQKIMKNKSVTCAGLFSLSETPALLKKMKLFVSEDTGPAYLADAVFVKTVIIAGQVEMKEQHPLNAPHIIVQKELYCSPCSFTPFPARVCKEKHLRCLKEVFPEDVFNVALKLINH
jgi:heptosyltransferase-2